MSDELNDFIQRGLTVQEAIDELLTTAYQPITCPGCGLSVQTTLRDNQLGLIMSQHDRENTGQLIDGRTDHFSAKLMQLIAKADTQQRRTLAVVYPDHVADYLKWLHTPTQPALPGSLTAVKVGEDPRRIPTLHQTPPKSDE